MIAQVLREATMAGARELERYFNHPALKTSIKDGGPNDLVTEADHASDKAIIGVIKSHFPDHFILSEETGNQPTDSEYKWIIDPIDGTIEVLNDLVEINNDRIVGYEKAASELEYDGAGLRELYLKMAVQSRDIVSQLRREIASMGGETEEGTTVSGKIYRAWMDVKSTFSSNKGESTLELCEYGEDAAQKAYAQALASEEYLSTETRQLIADQKADLKLSHDVIKRHRDASRNN